MTTSWLPVEATVPNLLQTHAKPTATGVSTTDEPPDAELVAAAQADLRAFAALYVRYLDPVHRFCFRRLGSREAAEDATSLVFMKALAAFPRFRDTSFRSWIFTIAHNVVTDRYRATRPDEPLEEAWEIVDAGPSPESLALATEERQHLQALLTLLSEQQRQVVELRLAGLSGGEIAQVLGCRPNSVAVTHSRAMAKLRLVLGQDGEQGTEK